MQYQENHTSFIEWRLHGVAPWDGRANSGKEGRVIIYFRPEADLGTSGWLNKP